MQRALARPIVQLAETARLFSREQKYSIRANATSRLDEIAILIEAFNEMLSQIQARDAALEDASERLNLALKSAGVATWSMSGDTVSWDEYMHPLFGLTPGIFPRTWTALLALIHPSDRDLVHTAVDDSLAYDGAYDIEFRAAWPDGTTHTLASRGKSYHDRDGLPARITGVCWDITDRKRVEEERRKFVSLVEQTDDFVCMSWWRQIRRRRRFITTGVGAPR